MEIRAGMGDDLEIQGRRDSSLGEVGEFGSGGGGGYLHQDCQDRDPDRRFVRSYDPTYENLVGSQYDRFVCKIVNMIVGSRLGFDPILPLHENCHILIQFYSLYPFTGWPVSVPKGQSIIVSFFYCFVNCK